MEANAVKTSTRRNTVSTVIKDASYAPIKRGMVNNPTSKSATDKLIRRKEVRLRCFCFRNIQMVSVFPTTWCFLLLLLFSLFFFLFLFDCLFVCLWSTNHSLGFQKRTSLQSEFNFKSEEKRVTFGLPQCSNFILLLCRTRNFLP